MAGRGVTCGFNGCRRPVSVQGDRCWQHVGMSDNGLQERAATFQFEDYERLARIHRAVSRNKFFQSKLKTPPDTMGKDGEITARASLYENHLGVSQDVVDAVYAAAQQCGAGGGATRDDKIQAIDKEQGFQRFQEHLRNELGHERISTLEVSGMSISHSKGYTSLPDQRYRATVIDFGEDGECLADPFAEVLVHTKKDGLLVTAASPLRDEVCVGSINEFIDGEVKWQTATVTTPDGHKHNLEEAGMEQAWERARAERQGEP